jgi:UDP-2,3-diacylglucosamine hydrolase
LVSDETNLFVSDLHFGRHLDDFERQRRDSFFRFLQAHVGVDRLIIAGDLFQFWIDLGQTLPKGYFDILQALAQFRARGARIDYLAGNHDWWRGAFWEDELGITIHPGDLELRAQGRRLLVQHGDGVGPGDHGYKLLKRFLRHPGTRAVVRRLHPDLVLNLAHRLDRFSHRHTSQQPVDKQRLHTAARHAFRQGYDGLVLGHVHAQIHETLPEGEFAVIGDWLTLHSYIRLQSGVLMPGRWETVDVAATASASEE